MIGLVIMYFVGKAFYDLAARSNKNKWVFAILGVASYYAGTFIAGVLMGVLILMEILPSLGSLPDAVLGLIGLPVGILCCWGFYAILKKQWSKSAKAISSEVLDGEI